MESYFLLKIIEIYQKKYLCTQKIKVNIKKILDAYKSLKRFDKEKIVNLI